MSRPSYETTTDKDNEARCKEALTARGYMVCEFGAYSPADFFAFSAEKVFLVEYKRRNHNYGTYETVFIPEQKLRKLLSIAEQLRCEVLYVIEYNDGFRAAVIGDYYTEMAGRKDRGDPSDYERMAFINKKEFYKLWLT